MVASSVSGTESCSTPHQSLVVSYVRAADFLYPVIHRQAQKISTARQHHADLVQRCGLELSFGARSLALDPAPQAQAHPIQVLSLCNRS